MGILAGALTGLGWGTIGFWMTSIHVGSVLLALLRLLSCFIAATIYTGAPVPTSLSHFMRGSLCGFILAVQMLTTIISFRLLPPGEATLLTNLHMVFLLFLTRSISIRKCIAVFFLILGIWMTVSTLGVYPGVGVTVAVFSSFLWAMYSLLAENLFNDTEKYFPIFSLTGAIFCLPLLLFMGPQTGTPVMPLLGLLIFSTGLPHILYIICVNRAGSMVAGALSYLSILVAFFIEALLSDIHLIQWFGVVISLFSILWILYLCGRRV